MAYILHRGCRYRFAFVLNSEHDATLSQAVERRERQTSDQRELG
jgi:hypothetical protein